jgi:hypothetical protein
MAIVIITDHEMSGFRQVCHKSGACDLVKNPGCTRNFQTCSQFSSLALSYQIAGQLFSGKLGILYARNLSAQNRLLM